MTNKKEKLKMSKYVKGLRILLVVITLMTLTFLLTACSERVVPESQIIHDIENQQLFSKLNVAISDFDILKRQTNIDEKKDIVYVAVTADNEDYSVTRSYVLTYVLYNDDWLLETFDPYFNEGTPDRITPLHGVLYEELKAYINSLDYSQFASFGYSKYSSFECEKIQLGVSFDEQFDLSDYMEINEDGSCEFSFPVTYQFYTFNEVITLPICCDFYNFGWHPYVDTSSISRELVLNENIVGLWGSDDDWFSIAGRLNITSYDEDGCFAELFTIKGKSPVEGKLILESLKRDNGKFSSARLKWENNNSYSSSVFIKLNAFEADTIQVSTMTLDGDWEKIE